MKDFHDVGGGWFLYDDPTNRATVVCDAGASGTHNVYGPAAWEGREGPSSGTPILEARAPKGYWDQVGPDEWLWFSEDGLQVSGDPIEWPRVIELKSEEYAPWVGVLSGRIVETEEELVDLLRSVTSSLPPRKLPCVSAETRLQLAEVAYPGLLG